MILIFNLTNKHKRYTLFASALQQSYVNIFAILICLAGIGDVLRELYN